MVRIQSYGSDSRIDFGRVLAIAAALVIHAIALLLLLMPLAAPQLAVAVKPYKPEIFFIERPKPVEPIPVTVTKPQPATRTPQNVAVTPRPTTITPPAEQPIVEGGSEPMVVPASEGPADAPTIAMTTGPIAASHLEYVTAPPPKYPREAVRDGAQGTVMLRVLVDTDGTPLEVSIDKSSGNKSLDREARQHVLKNWRFRPAMRDGVPVQAYGLVPIDFSLQ
ncbi:MULTISPECIES: energy transducer TonB [unclassified Pseudoxanthomonas]|jgi:protein TonB|uniref:energy transducer TonB n=1 Tax=unclassified Pseudoxanthomonas TaxID=2645906 RepID=UPI003076EEEC